MLSFQVMEWINNVGFPTLNQDPDLADCLSKAEIFKNNYETGFYAASKVITIL